MMKITGESDLQTIVSFKGLDPNPDSDLLQRTKTLKPAGRKARNPGYSRAGVKLKRDGALVGKRSRPETPLLRWKFDDGDKGKVASFTEERWPPEFGRRVKGGEKEVMVSVRKLAAVLWRLQLPEVTGNTGGGGVRSSPQKNYQLGFQYGASHIGVPNLGCHNSVVYSYEGKDPLRSPPSVSGPRNGYLCKFEPSFQFSNSAMEGATKWDPIYLKTSDEVQQINGHSKHLDEQVSAIAAVSMLEVELEQARTRIHELETEKRFSKKKIEHFLWKLSEERAKWRSREHEKVHAIIDDVKADLNLERKNRLRLEIVNSKLVNEMADAKLTAKRCMQNYEKAWKARELLEEVCDELAKEIGEDKAEVEALKRESMKLRVEVEEERKMLQMAEVWREERVQMKLVDVKVMLEEKYSQMNTLVADLEAFLNSRNASPDAKEMKKAEILLQTAASVNIQEIKEFVYAPPNPDDILSVFEDVDLCEGNVREIEPCVGFSPAIHASKIHTVSPEVNIFNQNTVQRHSNEYLDENGDVEEDGSGWETASHPEDHGSSNSPEGSDPSVNNIHQRNNNFSRNGTDWGEKACEETPITEIGAIPKPRLKVSSISRLRKSCPNNGENFKIVSVESMNGRVSNGRRSSNVASISPDSGGSGNGKLSPSDFMVGHWSSPDSGNPLHINRGIKGGCIDWPRGMQKNNLKAKHLEARTECQKIQLRQVLKQKI